MIAYLKELFKSNTKVADYFLYTSHSVMKKGTYKEIINDVCYVSVEKSFTKSRSSLPGLKYSIYNCGQNGWCLGC